VGRTIQVGESIVTRSITLQDDEGTLFKVNGQRLKIFLEPNKESKDLDEIEFFCFPTNINFRQ
jgi:hypothetical protein